MSLVLAVRNRYRGRHLNARVLRQITRFLLSEQLEIADAELGITLVAAPQMARLNWQFLRHEGSTDVITFDYTKDVALPVSGGIGTVVYGELYICIDDAIAQAHRFRTTWQAEVVRYVVHGVLHLVGYDDLKPGARRVMKQRENRLVKQLAAKFRLAALQR